MKKRIFLCLFLAFFPLIHTRTADDLSREWRAWLREVSPLMTMAEKETFKILQSEEERLRFREMFWRARDPDPSTPMNEWKEEYLRRAAYADKEYRGVTSERGRIYALMGKPKDIQHFSGHHDLVECELWHYEAGGRPGLPPFMNLLFFRPGDTGDFQLFYPGIHTPRSLLNPYYSNRRQSLQAAFDLVASISSELADASLSIIPGEGNPASGIAVSSSNMVLSQIFSLPERETPLDYLRAFKGVEGIVRISESIREILGYAHFSLLKRGEFQYLNFSLLPDRISLKTSADGRQRAEVVIRLRIENEEGTQVYQSENRHKLDFDGQQAQQAAEKKILFREYIPVIPGRFAVTASFFNETSKEFFSRSRDLLVKHDSPGLLLGFRRVSLAPGVIAPYSLGSEMILNDPRQLYQSDDTLAGIVIAEELPRVSLVNAKTGATAARIDVQPAGNGGFEFSRSLKGLSDGKYRILVETSSGETEETIHLMPFYTSLTRPLAMEKKEVSGNAEAVHKYIVAQEYLNSGDPERALDMFRRVPENHWPAVLLPVIARAFYESRQYTEVFRLLSPETVDKDFGVLVMLVNAAIETGKNEAALSYLISLRRLNDTPDISRRLAAVCLALGRREEAEKYFAHAQALEKTGD